MLGWLLAAQIHHRVALAFVLDFPRPAPGLFGKVSRAWHKSSGVRVPGLSFFPPWWETRNSHRVMAGFYKIQFEGRRSSQIYDSQNKKGAGATNTCAPILERTFSMPIIPHSDLTAMTGRDAKALTTSFARSEVLAFQGYKFRRLAENIVEAQGKPTFHKNRKTGETYVDPHGPYIINTDARTCTCPAFANRGGCCHLPYAKKWLSSWERGESMTVQLVEISKNPIALREIEGSRYQADSERRVVVFRDWQAAGDYWEREGLTSLCELVELRSVDLEEIAATGRYAGLSLTLADGERQPIPLPEVDWKARAARGGFVNRKDFD